MSYKINKNGKTYEGGVIPQNVIDDVTELKAKELQTKELTNVTSDATYGIVDLGVESGNYVVSVASTDGFLYLPLYVNSESKWYAVCVGVSRFTPEKNHTAAKLFVSYYSNQ
jgi:hypothetical protein